MSAGGFRIGIAGAGIGGLAAVALLARAGQEVTVFDQFEAPRPVGSGLVIQPVGQVVLQAAGAGEAALNLGHRIDRMLGLEVAANRCVLDFSYARNGDGRFGLAIHRASLFAALLDAARAAGATLCPSARVIATPLRGHRWLSLAGGTEAGPFDLVIDATGARSVLLPLHARTLDYGAIWGTVPWPRESALPTDQLTQRYRRANKMAGILPIGTLPGATLPLAAIFWSLPVAGHDAWRTAPLEAWKDEVGGLCQQPGPGDCHE